MNLFNGKKVSNIVRYKFILASKMWYKFLLLTTIVVSTCLTTSAQSSSTVSLYVDNKKVKHASHFVIKINSDTLRRTQIRKNFLRKLDGDYYVVEAADTTFAGHIIGPANNLWKIPSRTFLRGLTFPSTFVISTAHGFGVDEIIANTKSKVVRQHGLAIEVIINSKHDFEIIQRNPHVLFIKSSARAQEEAPNSLQDLSVNKINFVHSNFPELNGEDFTVAIKERTPDSTDIDLKNRITISNLTDDETTHHANMIATIIAGGGSSQPSSKGAAWKSRIVPTSFDNLLPDNDNILNQLNVTVQNHSYGTAIENFYGPEAAAYDQSVVQNPTRVHVFSSGNSGTQTSSAGPYATVEKFANITGNMKMAKNLLVTGAHYKGMEIDPRNSRGPAYDGRIKPDVVAYGPEGTSDAAGFVSGTCLLLQQRYKQIYGTLPKADVVKGALVATADDIGNTEVDFTTGFGAVNAFKAIQLINNQFVISDALTQDAVKTFPLTLPAGVTNLKVAIAWIDPPATAGSPEALVNDLDLKVREAGSGNEWMPWVLNSFPHVDSLTKAAKRGADHLNNIELVSIDNPNAGTYQFEIKAFDLQTATQAFAITYWYDMAETFQWTYPTAVDPVESGKEMYFRWNTTYEGQSTIELTLNNQQVLVQDVELKNGFAAIVMPDDNGVARAVMKINNQNVDVVDFTVSPDLHIKVEFNCDTAALISWPSVSNAESYNLFRMGYKYMEKLASLTDTTFLIEENTSPSYYAVAPIIDNAQGLRSFAYDVNNQGVGCYYSNFLAEATSLGQGRLTLNLSTLFNIDEIIWQKLVDGEFVNLSTTPFNNNLQNIYTDNSLERGVTQYRAMIRTKTNELVPTEVATVYYADDRTYALFPNPIARETELNILTNADDIILRFYDQHGKLVKLQEIPLNLFRMNVSDLSPGLYLYSIQRRSSIVSSGKILVK